jgi:myo-inositol-1(or 4)-monophosphatase
VAAIAAVAAGMRIASARATDHQVSGKDGRDVVTTADIEVENAIRSMLADALGLPSVGEEHGGCAPQDGSGYWLIDPICGTRNYASGIPLYCVNLALIEAGDVAVAVVGNPSRDELMVAERGGGAWLLGAATRRPLTVSDTSTVVIVEEGKSTGARRARAAASTQRIVQADRWDMRSLGTTLSLPYVACGRVSAYVAFDVTSIHSAAGVLLAIEAGATASDIDGSPWSLDSESVIAAATEELHGELLGLTAMKSEILSEREWRA